MELWVAIGGGILLVITAFYAWLLYRMLREIRQENVLYRTLIEKQLKASNQPHVYCDIRVDAASGALKLELFNIGGVPIYDVLLGEIGAYTEEGMDVSAFMRTFVQPRFRKYPLQVDKVGYYGIRGTVRCPILPIQQRLNVPVHLPIPPIDLYVFLQFRDISGSNYYQLYCFSEVDNEGNYRANLSDPVKAELLERFHLTDMDDASLPAEKTLPFRVRDFFDLWNHSISYRLTTLYAEESTPSTEAQSTTS